MNVAKAFGKISKCHPLLVIFPLPDLHFLIPLYPFGLLLRSHYTADLKAGIPSKPWRKVEGKKDNQSAPSHLTHLPPSSILPTKLPSHLCCCQWLPQHYGRLHHFKTKILNTTVHFCPFQQRFLACLKCLKIQMPYLFNPPLHCHAASIHSINQTQSKAIYLPSRGLITAWLTGLSSLCILAPRSSPLFFQCYYTIKLSL